MLDENVRKTWQMSPEKFELKNEKFSESVGFLLGKIQSGLGCEEASVDLKLYKLLLYEPGGHFKPHQDTEKHQGMFGTLIVQLPSEFTGGDLGNMLLLQNLLWAILVLCKMV